MGHRRSGFSLMEVLLSTAILVGSSVALIELATIGRKQASAAYDLNRAQLLCQSKLDEIVAGIVPLRTVESQEFEEDAEWLYSVEQTPLLAQQLIEVKVTVFQPESAHRKAKQFSLVRWLPDVGSKQPGAMAMSPSTVLQERASRVESRP